MAFCTTKFHGENLFLQDKTRKHMYIIYPEHIYMQCNRILYHFQQQFLDAFGALFIGEEKEAARTS